MLMAALNRNSNTYKNKSREKKINKGKKKKNRNLKKKRAIKPINKPISENEY